MSAVNDMDFTDSRVREFLAQQESDEIHFGDHHSDEVLDLITNGEELSGLKLPWPRTHDQFRLAFGDVSLWAGINGHLKSFVTSQIAVHVARSVPVGIASFEMPVPKTLHRMICQSAGTRHPAAAWARDFMKWTNPRIAFYNRLDVVPKNRVLGCVYHMATALRCRLVVVDSLMMVGGVAGDMEAEKEFMGTLTALAKSLDIHIALVHHVRKGDSSKGEYYMPKKDDVKGNGALMDMAALAVIVWNAKRKKDLKSRLEYGDKLTPDEMDYYENAPDQMLKVVKHRHGEFEGKVPLWVHESVQFTQDKRKQAIPLHIPRLAA